MNFAFVECTKCLKLVNFEWKHLKSLLNPIVYRRFSEKNKQSRFILICLPYFELREAYCGSMWFNSLIEEHLICLELNIAH